jgi:hypothetical protein
LTGSIICFSRVVAPGAPRLIYKRAMGKGAEP